MERGSCPGTWSCPERTWSCADGTRSCPVSTHRRVRESVVLICLEPGSPSELRRESANHRLESAIPCARGGRLCTDHTQTKAGISLRSCSDPALRQVIETRPSGESRYVASRTEMTLGVQSAASEEAGPQLIAKDGALVPDSDRSL